MYLFKIAYQYFNIDDSVDISIVTHRDKNKLGKRKKLINIESLITKGLASKVFLFGGNFGYGCMAGKFKIA